jgi:DNA-binding NtrC family response regulator
VRRLIYLCPDGQDVDWHMLSERVLVSREEEAPSSLSLEANVDHLERRLIRAALARVGGKRSAAATVLGISRNGLAMKMERLGLGLRNVAFDADALIPRG